MIRRYWQGAGEPEVQAPSGAQEGGRVRQVPEPKYLCCHSCSVSLLPSWGLRSRDLSLVTSIEVQTRIRHRRSCHKSLLLQFHPVGLSPVASFLHFAPCWHPCPFIGSGNLVARSSFSCWTQVLPFPGSYKFSFQPYRALGFLWTWNKDA